MSFEALAANVHRWHLQVGQRAETGQEGVKKGAFKVMTRESPKPREEPSESATCRFVDATRLRSTCDIPPQFREVIKARDSRGMTMLHHAVNGKSDERALHAPAGAPPTNDGERLPPVAESQEAAEAQPQPATELPHVFSLDQRLPVIQSVLEFARAKLWMPEVRVGLDDVHPDG